MHTTTDALTFLTEQNFKIICDNTLFLVKKLKNIIVTQIILMAFLVNQACMEFNHY